MKINSISNIKKIGALFLCVMGLFFFIFEVFSVHFFYKCIPWLIVFGLFFLSFGFFEQWNKSKVNKDGNLIYLFYSLFIFSEIITFIFESHFFHDYFLLLDIMKPKSIYYSVFKSFFVVTIVFIFVNIFRTDYTTNKYSLNLRTLNIVGFLVFWIIWFIYYAVLPKHVFDQNKIYYFFGNNVDYCFLLLGVFFLIQEFLLNKLNYYNKI